MIFENLHIVIAEDDLDDGPFISDSFSRHGSFTKVTWLKNGKELIDFLRQPEEKNPDIILTDINMPLMNGIEALEEIFNDSSFSDIATFTYSSTSNPVYEKKCRELGTLGFLTKPFSLLEFDEIPYQIIYILKNAKGNS